jgi:hypothetical protein|tara:strand:+ start:806 stop:1435 length:630 start_codon:yes stop_codon:yes gene_type:complete
MKDYLVKVNSSAFAASVKNTNMILEFRNKDRYPQSAEELAKQCIDSKDSLVIKMIATDLGNKLVSDTFPKYGKGDFPTMVSYVQTICGYLQLMDDEDQEVNSIFQLTLDLNGGEKFLKELKTLPSPVNEKSITNKGCYIATMVYGDYGHPKVIALRGFRDNFLEKSLFGNSFIYFYYRHSPGWVKALENNRLINHLIRGVLNIFIKIIK